MNQIKEFLNDHKKIAITGLALVILISAFFVARSVMQKNADFTENMVFETLARGPLSVYVSAIGVVTSNQSAVLNWSTSGEIEEVTPYLGQSVVAGDLLASLDESSLSPFVILALADLVSAQKSLDDLLLSSTQQAQSLKAVENAEQSLEDARDPSKLQADALLILAEKAKALESAQRRYDILTTPPTELVINQAYANRLLAQQALADLEEQIDRFERKVNSAPAVFLRNIYQKALDGLQLRLHSQLARYNDTLEKYAILTSPPDPLDMIVAQAELATAQAQYAGARLSWERIKNGLSAADIAILEAVLSDAHREWER
ncbi:MAG: efflux RND transporter periplasmic adaptor subunit, partial [Chloroflexi bacterium]|nr:efflux RND transporter periplasmic adaptor subunit [Chloroflexota bacterium]